VTGTSGMLGSAVVQCTPASLQVIPFTRADADLTERSAVERAVAKLSPQTIIHCAAYADVDGCTTDPQRAWANNADATRLLAEACRENDVRLVYVSTDYVFSGTKCDPYTPEDAPNPINVYGESKLAGEQAVAECLEDYLIVRTQWLYGPGSRHFVEAVIRRARSGQLLRVVCDEMGSPTYVCDLAEALWLATASELTGVVHVTNSGFCSRLKLAREALDLAGMNSVQIEPIRSDQWPSSTRRPLHAILNNSRWIQAGYPALRPWQQALADFIGGYFLS
jgi:dTDP-4-dehydrorhamnose reductase